MLLSELLLSLPEKSVTGPVDTQVTGLAMDSRAVKSGDVFFAIRGTAVDGHRFMDGALAAGAAAIVCEEAPAVNEQGATIIIVKDAALAAGLMAAAFYGQPSQEMVVVGVTGTNGKTTCCTLLYKLFSALGYRCGLISTVQNHIGETVEVSTHTTPDALSIQALLGRMRDAGCSHVFMEVSSHAVHQRRIAGIRFAGGVFTNITHDHLDYHKTFDEYIRVKKAFFDGLPKGGFALSNSDDKRGGVMLQNTAARRLTYALRQPADYKGKVLENNLTGLVLDVNGRELYCRLIGTFNAYNILAVYGVALELGEDKEEVLQAISDLSGAAGRFETYLSPREHVLGIVDYAHTPDALINVLATVNQLRSAGQRLITLIGCGGDRDAAKRPLMAQAACEHSDQAILTADNPRTEDPEAILNDMERDLTAGQRRRALRITDRREAIKTAVRMAHPKDIILIAGKGHETYQEINGIKHPFDDKKVLAEAFQLFEK